ncbi:MAG: hypothetical protein IPN69_09255 [Acidobacteria bacterium]|nr:hypothetical protein [Acidobacteriota bacterium]
MTGSTATWRKIDNDWLTSVEETEPLGQKIYNADPDPVPDPSYENAMRNADFPQWQCAVSDDDKDWGAFDALPFHCQMQILKDLSRSLDAIYGFWNPNNETSPSNVPGPDPTPPATPPSYAPPAQSVSSRLLARFSYSTSKRNDEMRKPKLRPEFVDIKIDELPIIDMEDTGWVESAIENRDDDLSSRLVDDLADFLLANENCGLFLDSAVRDYFNIVDPADSDDSLAILLSTLQIVDETSTDGYGAIGRGMRNDDDSLGGRIRIFMDFIEWGKNVSSTERGKFVFHEVLHILFGGHRDVVEKLSLKHPPFPPIPPQPMDGFYRYSDEGWTAFNRRRDGSDAIADRAMRDWIDNDCANTLAEGEETK